MVIELLATFLLAGAPALSAYPRETDRYFDHLILEKNERDNYTLMGIDGFEGSEFRIYHYKDYVIDEIDDNAFVNQNFDTLVLTNSVKKVSNNAFLNASSIRELKYTGNYAEFSALEISYEFPNGYSLYSVDEGFINYWNEKIRPTAESNICNDIDYKTFQEVYGLYLNLSEEDRAIVDEYEDAAQSKIKDSIVELKNHFNQTPNSNKTEEWNQTAAITLITVIALIGMTSITIFFLLKTKNIIN